MALYMAFLIEEMGEIRQLQGHLIAFTVVAVCLYG